MQTQNTTLRKRKFKTIDAIDINSIVYEEGDDGVLVECDVTKGNLTWASRLCMDFAQFNDLLGHIEKERGTSKEAQAISENLMGSDDPIREANMGDLFGMAIRVNRFEFRSSYAELEITAA